VVLGCTDGGIYVGSITWSAWTSTGASGEGRYTYNDCWPIDCAGGTFLSVVARVTVSDARNISGQRLFTHLVVSRGDGATWTFNWVPGRSGNWDSRTTGFVLAFSPSTHLAALRSVLESKDAGQVLNKLSVEPSPLNSTWVLYHAGLKTTGGEDNAEGYAHFVAGSWINVFGPASGFCTETGPIPGLPRTIRTSLARWC
jgi:hypothetical protein